ncbi:hypothetical protein [Halocola ammonii]
MKRIYLFIGFTALILISCGKYEEGPMFSLRTKKARLANTWEVDKAELNGDSEFNGQSVTSLFEGHAHEINKDGTFSFSSPDYETITGDWEFSDDKEEVEFETEDGDEFEWEIIRLTNNELFIEQEDQNGNLFYLEMK